MKPISIRGPIVPTNDKFIYDFFGMECACPADIAKALNEANGADVVVEINSKGGDLQAGVEMYALLKDYPGSVHSKIMSWCYSAATFPACAGSAEITPGGLYLIHNVNCSAHGDYRIMESTGALLKTANQTISDIYCSKTGKSREEILALMDEERTLSAMEAVDAGFVDKLMFQSGGEAQAQPLVADGNSGLLPQSVIERTKKLLGDGKKAALVKAEIEILELEVI